MNPGALILGILRREASRADCTRRRVSAVIVLNGVIVGKGHNDLPVGSCRAGDCPRGRLSYDQQPKDVGYEASGCTSLHAEDNALAEAGERAVGAIAYVSEWPCPRCYGRLQEAGVIGVMHVDLTLPRMTRPQED